MRALVLLPLLLVAHPAAVPAQDVLAPLRDLVEELVPPQRTAPSRTQAPVPPQATESEAKPVQPPLPRPRPDGLGEGEAREEDAEVATRPEPGEPAVPEVEPEQEETPAAVAPPPPVPEDTRIYQVACPALLSGLVIGEMLPPIEEGQCGERSPLSLTGVRVNGHEIGFSSPVTTNCAMAGAIADWVGEVDAYARGAMDSPVATLVTGTSMMCRARNGGDASAMSEHGFANALDVVGFALEDGTTVNVEAGWTAADSASGRLLRQAHGAACGRFTTVLGPDANAEHEDHLHLDLGCHGQSCTARICE